MPVESIDIARSLGIEGWMSEPELRWLAWQATTHKLIIEIGSYLGRSSRALAENTVGKVICFDDWYGPRASTDKKPDGSLFTEDDRISLFDIFSNNMADLITMGKAMPIRTDYNEIEHSDLYLAPDMIFIDGDHSFDAVSRDLRFWVPKASVGGLICGHDYNYSSVTEAVNKFFPKVETVENTSIWYTSK